MHFQVPSFRLQTRVKIFSESALGLPCSSIYYSIADAILKYLDIKIGKETAKRSRREERNESQRSNRYTRTGLLLGITDVKPVPVPLRVPHRPPCSPLPYNTLCNTQPIPFFLASPDPNTFSLISPRNVQFRPSKTIKLFVTETRVAFKFKFPIRRLNDLYSIYVPCMRIINWFRIPVISIPLISKHGINEYIRPVMCDGLISFTAANKREKETEKKCVFESWWHHLKLNTLHAINRGLPWEISA